VNKLCDKCRRAGRVWCPHNAAIQMRTRLAGSIKQEMFGPSPPMLFVGHNFYPNVYWGPLVSAEGCMDEPGEMYGMPLEKILEARSSMVRGMKRGKVKLQSRMLADAQDAAMSIKRIDVEAKFTRPPAFSLELDDISSPVGASAPIERFRLADNPSIPKKVDELYDEGVKASQAIGELLDSGFDVHYLSKLLTSGILGRKEGRKLVPTKWAITATDDTAGKRLMESIREYREISSPALYSNTYLENHFEILLLPGSWEYEQFECALTPELESMASPKKQKERLNYSHAAWADWKSDGRVNFSQEYEPYFGRSKYAHRQGGGYYAARFGVAEALYRMGRQARAIVFREIGTGYSVPVGVWEVRENVRHAFQKTPEKFATREEALRRLSEKLAVPLSVYKKQSRVLLQRRLIEF
jgi:hypothetical protein